MELQKIRTVAVPIGVFVILGLLLLLFLKVWTDSPSIIRSDVMASINARMEQDAAAYQESVDASAANTAVNPATVEREARQQETFSELVQWTVAVVLSALFLAVLWNVAASKRQRSVVGPRGQSALLPLWIGLACAYVAVVSVLFWWFLRPANLDDLIGIGNVVVATALVGIVSLIGYWLATCFGTSAVMRPSVPFSFLLTR